MLWQRETQQTTKICWCGNCSATRSRNACLPAPQGLIRPWGCLRSARACLAHTRGTFSPSPLLFLCSFLFSSLAVPLCSVRKVEAAKLPVPARDGSLPSPTPPGNKQLSQQHWRRRIRCAGMEQPVPVSQQRFNLPLAYKQQMFVQLTCKQAACIAAGPRHPAPRSAAPCFLPSSRVGVQGDRAGDEDTATSRMLRAPQARWLEPGSDAQRDPILQSCCCIPSAPLSIAAGVQSSHGSQA